MAKTKISEFSATPGNNTDIDSINIAEGCAPSGINDAIRELMAQLKDWQSGTSNDPMVIGSTGSLTLSYGTANGIPYLNGSKVLTSGSALVFDGTNLGVGTSSPTWLLSLRKDSAGSGAGQYPVVQINNANAAGYAGLYMNDSTALAGLETQRSTAHLGFYAGGAEKMRLDASGNLGLGVTPSAWGSGYKAVQIGGNSHVAGLYVSLASNAYHNGTNWLYSSTNYASRYDSNFNAGGIHAWFTAPSGTAGNAITFTQAMTLDASGNLLVGTATTTKNARLNQKLVVVSGGTYGGASLTSYAGTSPGQRGLIDMNRSRGVTDGSMTAVANNDYLGSMLFRGSDGTDFQDSSMVSGEVDGTVSTGNMPGRLSFHTAGATGGIIERARIDSSGNLLVGATSAILSGQLTIAQRSSSTSHITCDLYNASTKAIRFGWYGGEIGSISVNAGGTAIAYNTSSDYRLKNITGPITTSGAYIDSLNPVEGTWKIDGSTFVGLLAHEAQEVSRTEVATGEKDGEEMQGMSYSSSEMIANMIAELKALRARVAALEAA